MKKTLSKASLIIAMVIFGALSLFWLLGTIATFYPVFIVLFIISAIPFFIFLRKYRNLTRDDRELVKMQQQAEKEKAQLLHQMELSRQQKELENAAQIKQMEIDQQQLQFEKEAELRKKAILEQQKELDTIITNNNMIATNQQTPPAFAPIPQAEEPIVPADPSISTDELLLLRIDSLSTSGVYFENVACELLRANGFKNISTTPTSNDYGIDILAEKDGISYAIQCKCYSSPIGNKAVQEAYTGKMYYKCMVAAVLTNSTFTKGAVETAAATQVMLWDRNKLIELINALPEGDLARMISTEFVAKC